MGLSNPQKPFFLEIVLVSKTKAFKSYNVTEHLKKFEYSVVSEEGGALSYKIDVINPMDAVEDLFKEYLLRYYADIKADNLSWFPQILIQWGYGKEKEDGLSKIHLATVTDLKYTFSSGKEKVLSITAVGDASFLEEYVEGFLKARWYGPIIEKTEEDKKRELMGVGEWAKWQGWKQYEGSNLRFTDVIKDLLGKTFKHYPRTEVDITQIDWDSLEDILRKSYHEYVIENMPKSQDHLPPNTREMTLYRAQSTVSKEAAFKILEYFGFQVNFNDLEEEYKTGYYLTEFSKIGPGGVGETQLLRISKNQLTSAGYNAVKNILRATKEKISAEPLNLPVDSVTDFEGAGEGFDPGDNTTYNVISSPDDIITQAGPSSFGLPFLPPQKLVRIRSENGKEFDAYITPYSEDKIHAAVRSRNKLAIAANEDYQKLVTDGAGLDRDWKATAPKEIKYESLSKEQRADLLRDKSRLVVSYDSPEGIPLKSTIFELVEKINAIFNDPEESLTVYTQSPPLFEERGSNTLEQIWKKHVDSREDVTKITVTPRKSVAKKDYKDSDMEIFSYPQLNMEGEPFSTSRLTYGGNDSTVRFFDFTSDLAYMTQSLQGILSVLSMGNNAVYLTHDKIKKSLFYFVKELTDDDKFIEDGNVRKNIRSNISAQEGNDRSAIELNQDTLDFLKTLQSSIESKEVRKIFRKSGDPKLVESFKAFILMLQHRASFSQLFNIESGSHASTYRVIFGDSEEIFNTESNIAYTLKKDNIFSQYNDNALSQNQLVKIYASDYLRGYPTQVRIKSLGIPEFDTILDVSNHKSIVLDVHDLSKERITGIRNIHWISGTYSPFEIKHTVSPSEGYLTEMSLLRNGLGTSNREVNNG